MNRKHYQLIITLKSDLCVGSGYSYAGIVDSDICYDSFGIPYIPAKRLKGCMREAAELIGLSESERNALFGQTGQDCARGIFLDNAYIENYEELRKEFMKLEPSLRSYITVQNVLEQFTSVKAQTKIDRNGVAKDNALRFIRTVNHYLPTVSEEKETTFIADAVLAGVEDEDLQEKLTWVAEAVRNIGLNRNRGLGSVRCTWKCISGNYEGNSEIDRIDYGIIQNSQDRYILKYALRNISPLIISVNNDFKTEKYISGRSVLGYLAGEYLASGKSADTEEFAELFLKNQVIYSGLYPADTKTDGQDKKKERMVYYPAPYYINCLKKTKKYVNVTKEIPLSEKDCEQNSMEAEYASEKGNLPKKMRGKFIHLENGSILVKEVASDIVYHHTKNREEDNGLYMTEVIRRGQIFAGEITGTGEQLKILGPLLQKGRIRFGKSRTSQYGTCVLDDIPRIEPINLAEKVYAKDSRILVVLRSDAIFQGEDGYTVKYHEVRKQIRDILGIRESNCENQKDDGYTEIETGVLNGYYAKWNLKRPAVPVIKAGSTFEFYLDEELKISGDFIFVGECIGEGFGRAEIVLNTGEDCRIPKKKKEDSQTQQPEIISEICRRILLSEVKERLMRKAVHANLKFPNSSSLGRIILMLIDSINFFPSDPVKRYEDFSDRIDCIKKKETKTKAISLIQTWICADKKKISLNSLKYLPEIEDMRALYVKAGAQTDRFEQDIIEIWSDYLMAILIQEKYNLKRKGEK